MAPNLDPFGRDRAAYHELSKQRRVAEREARRYTIPHMDWKLQLLIIISDRVIWLGLNRARRRQAREQNGTRTEHKEGLSSDDEETSTDISSFNLERGVMFLMLAY